MEDAIIFLNGEDNKKNEMKDTTTWNNPTNSPQAQYLINAIIEFQNTNQMTNVQVSGNTRNNSFLIYGEKNNIAYTTTLQQLRTGQIETNSKFHKCNGNDRTKQIKELYKLGYKQIEIAQMLGISQSAVSQHLKK